MASFYKEDDVSMRAIFSFLNTVDADLVAVDIAENLSFFVRQSVEFASIGLEELLIPGFALYKRAR